ncbi:MAG: PD-(D/E)XK nuclease family protein [Candidatus Brocadiae bacterium]|nr:PD-(D/E)XK nuclease family protein [Candidatus Brocadiia bacterium]
MPRRRGPTTCWPTGTNPSGCPRLRYLFVVENKVYAGEQKDQLSRYSLWLDAQQRFYDTRVLVFLTPGGREATSSGGCEYLRLSYRQDVVALLERARSQVQAPAARLTVAQYLDVIMNL